MKLLKLLPVILLLLITGCENPVVPEEPPVKCEVLIENNDFELESGDSIDISVEVSSLNSSNCNNGVIWSTNNDKVSFERNGDNSITVKALFDGSTVIKAKSVDDSLAVDQIKGIITFNPIMIVKHGSPAHFGSYFLNVNKQLKEAPGYKWVPNDESVSRLTKNTGHYELLVVDLENNQENKIMTNIFQAGRYDWNNNGSKVVIGMRESEEHLSEIYSYNIDSEELKRLTFEFPNGVEGSNSYKIPGNPKWSPDGSKIAFVTSRDDNSEIYLMNPDGSDQVNITNNPNYSEGGPSWSPDGSKIAFIRNRSDIWIMNSDGSSKKKLTNLNHKTILRVGWVPDGTRITITMREADGGPSSIWTMNPDGSDLKVFLSELKDGKGFLFPEWKPEIDMNKIDFKF